MVVFIILILVNNQKVIISKLEQDKLRKLLLKIINNAIKDE